MRLWLYQLLSADDQTVDNNPTGGDTAGNDDVTIAVTVCDEVTGDETVAVPVVER